jgi:hypothetical protein
VVVALAGCAAHEVGLVDASGRRAVLSTVDGDRVRLVLVGDAADLGGLDAHLVEVDGQRTPAGLRVGAFRVLEGPHALSVWYGPVQRWGAQIGILDLASGGVVWLDEETAQALAPHVGQRVAVEGYVEGPSRIRVQHRVILE